MEPLPWLQFAPMQTPELPKRGGGIGEALGQLGTAGVQAMQRRGGRNVGPPAVKFPTKSRAQIAESAGNAANAAAGEPPPLMRRRQFPNPQQQQQLDAMIQ